MRAARLLVLVGEDALSLALLRRLIVHADRGFCEYLSEVAGGAQNIRNAVQRYRNASKAMPHVVLTDLDKAKCPPQMLHDWGLAGSPSSLLFRIAVSEAETWLLADADGLATFIGIPSKRIPHEPEDLQDPKQTLVNLARRSRNRRLRAELVPSNGSAVPIGPLYNERLTKFVSEHWNPARAATAAPSLRRTIKRLQSFLP